MVLVFINSVYVSLLELISFRSGLPLILCKAWSTSSVIQLIFHTSQKEFPRKLESLKFPPKAKRGFKTMTACLPFSPEPLEILYCVKKFEGFSENMYSHTYLLL